jgi:putative hydrolase of the HAD superfamily
MKQVRAVFLDVGMTLIEPHVPLEEAIHVASTQHGFETSLEAFAGALRRAEGHFWTSLQADRQIFASQEKIRRLWLDYYLIAMREAGVTASPEDQRRCAEAICDRFERHESWTAYPDVLPALEALRRRGYILGAVSDWSHGLTDILHALGISRYLDFAVGSATVGAAKPSGHIFELALRRAGVAAAEAVHTGDSYYTDVIGARAAGLTPVLLDRHRRNHPADCAVIHSLSELPDLIDPP